MSVWKKLGAPLSLLLSIFSGCSAGNPRFPDELQDSLERLRVLGDSWVEETDGEDGRALAAYRSFFGFQGEVLARGVDTPSGRVFLVWHRQRSRPERAGAALFAHGYMAHAGHFAELAARLSDHGWDLFLVDLPGHGLSYGRRYGIDSFEEYGSAVAATWQAMPATLGADADLPLALIGHSTGCSAIIEALPRLQSIRKPDGVVLAAPLVDFPNLKFRSAVNGLANGKDIRIPAPFIQSAFIPKGVICNPAYREFSVTGDPLYERVYDPSWLEAYAIWREELDSVESLDAGIPVLVLQGTGDSVVGWKSGRAVLERLFPRCEWREFKGFSHTILNVDPERMDAVMAALGPFLAGLR